MKKTIRLSLEADGNGEGGDLSLPRSAVVTTVDVEAVASLPVR